MTQRKSVAAKVRPGGPRRRFLSVRRTALFILRWTFLLLGALVMAALSFQQIYTVNRDIYDPAAFAMGIAGLFAIMCGVALIQVARSRRQRQSLQVSASRCEALADLVWELREAEERMASLLEAQGDLIVRRDAKGRISYASDAFCRAAGQPREALQGADFALPTLNRGETQALADGTRIYDQEIATADGPRWLAWRETSVRIKGGDTETQSVGRDVTDRVHAVRSLAEARDHAEAANHAKSRFLTTVSHEIRTPLNGILGMTDLLRDTPLTPEQATYVAAARTSGTALLTLIEDILDFSKIEADRLVFDAQPFSLRAMVEEVVELLAPRAQSKGFEIAGDVADDLPPRVIGDAMRVRQVLLNLAGNAIKFTAHGGVGIVVRRDATSADMVLTVSDSGPGIPAADRERVFGDFEQGDAGAARRFGGTGLGLAISRRIVEAMNGAITLDSEVGSGTAFHIRLPLAGACGEPVPAGAAPDLGGQRIRVVARDTIPTRVLAGRLAQWGADIDIRAADDAMATHEGRVDALLVDQAIGTAAAIAALKRHDATSGPRIVMVAPGARADLDSLIAAGFDGFLIKPVRKASLAAQLHPGRPRPEAIEPPKASPAAVIPMRGLSVLVAEDNPINALLTAALLRKLGHRPTTVDDGAKAVEAWRDAQQSDAPYDLVLMDVQMPAVDGLEATRRIRAQSGANGASVPIVALTANALAEDRRACLDAGMNGFLVKPLDRERLAAALAPLSDRTLAA